MKRVAVWALLVWILGAGLFLAQRDSLTTDEGIHVSSGYLILTRGDWRFDPEHPPLMKLLSALPLLAVHPHLPPEDAALWAKGAPTLFDSWKSSREWTDQWFYRSGNNADLMVFLMRIPAVFLLVLLGFLTYFAGKEWFSERVGLWALFLVAFNPTLLGHGHLANDDVAVSVGILGALLSLVRWYNNPSKYWAIVVGLTSASAICLKYSGIIVLIPIIATLLAAHIRNKKNVGSSSVIILVTMYVTIWSLYGFRSAFIVGDPVEATQFLRNQVIPFSLTTVSTTLNHLRWLLPIPFIKGLILVKSSSLVGRGAYILGMHFSPSIWFYFPVLFLLKTQLIALVAGFWGLITLRTQKLRAFRIQNYLLTLTISLIVISAVLGHLNLGIRHISAFLPLLSIALACVLVRLNWKLLALFAPLYFLPIVIQLPYIIGYTNLLVQPHSEGWKYMDGSNLDWGQQSKQAATLIKQLYPGQTVATNYYWNPYALEYYGLKITPLNTDILPVGQPILITASTLTDPNLGQLSELQPVAIISNSTFIYYIKP